MNDFLFTVPESPSPRLQWLRKHKLITFHSLPGTDEACWFAGFDQGDYKHTSAGDFFGNEVASYGGIRIEEGDTEDEAIVLLCRKYGVKLWNEL